MAKLQDLFTQARRTQNGGSIGFLGKNKASSKAHAAALVVESTQITAGSIESALKAGADGLLFHWNGQDSAALETLKQEISANHAQHEDLVTGLNITGGWDKLNRDSFTQIKDLGVQYVVLPFNAPSRLLAFEAKELQKVIIVPMRKGEIYPLYIHNLTAFEGIAGVSLDFALPAHIGSMSIEEVLDYRAVREAVRYPAFLHVSGDLSEPDAYTVLTLGVQGVILTASSDAEATTTQIKHLREILEAVHQNDQDQDSPNLLGVHK